MKSYFLLFGLLLSVSGGAVRAEAPPCGETTICPAEYGAAAQRLHDAWNSPATTSYQKKVMDSLIDMSKINGVVDWEKVAVSYFTWINSIPKSNGIPNYGNMRVLAENAVKARLIDPSSAQFDWPFGFFNGTWKPLFRSRISGHITCGFVNSKNRLGGYVGRTPFVVVVNDSVVSYLELGTGGNFDPTSIQCNKSVGMFPSPQPGMLEVQNVTRKDNNIGVADELKKLIELRDKGHLSIKEYEIQKQKLLSD